MVNVFGDSIAIGPGNLQVVRKVVVTKGKFKDYCNEIQQSYELGFTPYRLHKNADLSPPFVMMERYMYWTMFPRWRLAIARLQRIQLVVNWYIW